MSFPRIIEFREDFLGSKTFSTTADANGWAVVLTGSGTPTVTTVTGTASGAARLALDGTSGAQSISLYQKDSLNLDYAGLKRVVYHARLNSPDPSQETFIGVAAAHNASLGSIAERVGFVIDGTGAIKCVTDDGNTDSGNVSTGITMTGGVDYKLEVNMVNKGDVRFLVNGVRQCKGTKFNASAYTGSLQVYCRNGKTSGSGTPSLDVDFLGFDEQCA